MDRPLALVTGASAGIGRAIARQLSREGHDVIIVARRKPELDSLAIELEAFGAKAHVLAQDLGQPDAAEKTRAFAELIGPVEVLVNNAGFAVSGPSWQKPERQLAMVDLNVRALTALSNAFLPKMLERRRGRILNVASIAGLVPTPWMAVYAATKAYVVSYSSALHEELRGTGVTVTALCPGPVETEFSDVAGMSPEGFEATLQSAEEVAEAGLLALRAGKAVAASGAMPGAAALALKLVPRQLSAFVSGKVMKKASKS